MGVTERPRSLNPSKAIAMAICAIIVHFSTWRARSMHDVACEFARAVVRSKDAQKQLARTSLKSCGERNTELRAITTAELQTTTQTLRATKYSIKSTYSDLPCDFKVNRGKLALINRPWKCIKKGKDRRSLLVHSRKLAEA